MTDKIWKATERKIMSILGGKRIPVTGRTRGDKPDGEHPWICPEIKHRESLPNWLHDAMDQAQKSKQGEQLPIVVLHESGMKHTDDYVVVRLGDFRDWFGASKSIREQEYPEPKPFSECEGC